MAPSTGLADTEITLMVDPDGPGETFCTAMDSVRLTVDNGDLDIDSDNTSTGGPGRTQPDELLEDRDGATGKIIVVNDGDKDGDGVPDLADGFAGSPGGANDAEYLVPMVLDWPLWIDPQTARFSFEYDASDPADSACLAPISGNTPGYQAAPGRLRIWTSSDPDRFVRDRFVRSFGAGNSSALYSIDDLDYHYGQPSIRLYVEAVRPSRTAGDLSITAFVQLTPDAPAGQRIKLDTVRLTAIEACQSGANSGAVRYADGIVTLTTEDLTSTGFGYPWSQSRTYTTQLGLTGSGVNGNGFTPNLPFLVQATSTVIFVNGDQVRYFDRRYKTGAPGNPADDLPPDTEEYVGRFGDLGILEQHGWNGDYVLTEADGSRWCFYNFNGGNGDDNTVPFYQRGAFRGYVSPHGVETWASAARTPDGKVLLVSRGEERWVYEYYNDNDTASQSKGLLKWVTLQRRTADGTGWRTLRRVAYSYYDDSSPYGNRGDLEVAAIVDGLGNTIDIEYYRYEKKADPSAPSLLKFVVGADAYARMRGDGLVPETESDGVLAAYADYKFKYVPAGPYKGRVESQWIAGAGGMGTQEDPFNTAGQFNYTYKSVVDVRGEGTDATGFNIWRSRTTVELPGKAETGAADHTVYTNFAGQVMLETETAAGNTWCTFNKYDDCGRLVLAAQPSAVTGFDPDSPDLLGFAGDWQDPADIADYNFISADRGLIQVMRYGTDADVDVPSAGVAGAQGGEPKGLLVAVTLTQGRDGTPVPQLGLKYFKREVTGWEGWYLYGEYAEHTVRAYFLASRQAYAGPGGETPITTTYEYAFSYGLRPDEMITHLPAVPAEQNGTGETEITQSFDWCGNPIWTTDGEGYVSRRLYDAATGAVTGTLTDFDYDDSGGLNLLTTAEVDDFGRPILTYDASGTGASYAYVDSQDN